MDCKVINNSKYLKKRFKFCKIRRFKKVVFIMILLIFFILILASLYFVRVVNPIILSYANSKIEKLLTCSSNIAIADIISDVTYDDLITIQYNDKNEIMLIKANINEVNTISNNLAKSTQNNLDKEMNLGISIPIGTCSGISLLAGKGSNVNININPIGNVVCEFLTIFTNAGINQTSHKIYVKIKTEAFLILPFLSKRINKEVDFLISECIIIGHVPNTYLNVSKLIDLE